MTTGIYALYWEEQDLIYIGKAQKIEKRFKDHLSKLISGKEKYHKGWRLADGS